MDFSRFEWLTFDCFGTLVDWETGISDAVREVLAHRGVDLSQSEVLALFAELEPQVQTGGSGFLDYRGVLRRVMGLMVDRLGLGLTGPELERLPDSLGDWPVFPDTVSALQALKARYRLAIISNVDDDLFAATARNLAVDFDAVVTSRQVGSYKPDLRNFHAAQERMGAEKERWLHVAESLYHDITPANTLGIATVWVNRSQNRKGAGATRPATGQPDLEVPDLATLVATIDLGSVGREAASSG